MPLMTKTSELTLDLVAKGKKVKLLSFNADSLMCAEFSSLGFLPGDEIEVVERAPFGGPISINHRNQLFALRKELAKLIITQEISL